MRGRKNTTESIKAAKGTLQKCRVNTNAVKVSGNVLLDKLPTAPREFPTKWKKFYLMVAQELIVLNQLTSVGSYQLYRYTNSAIDWDNCKNIIKEQGYVTKIVTAQGTKMDMINPHISVMRQAEKEMRAFESEFGLTPAARSRIIGNVSKVNIEEEEFENL